jgi:mono/diheme cytochrome c family protein
MARIAVFTFTVLVAWTGLKAGDESLPPAATRAIDFAKDIQPLFKEHCLKCHGASRQRGDLRLDVKSAALKGGESFAPAIIPGEGADSPLVRFSAGVVDGMQMPPEGEKKLSAEEIGLLRAWIDQGAKWPETAPNGIESARHWSFQPLLRPEVPDDSGISSTWPKNQIDAFVATRLLEVPLPEADQTRSGLQPSPAADRVQLIRRVTYDLTGLPPTPDEVGQFLADPQSDAYERSVDRLLASPHFGERWARHWLDIVRFAESDGFETNQPRPNAWPYRDYVIRAFNDDKPINRFLFEQIAGDTVGVDEATGFIVGGAWDRVKSPDPGLTAQQRADELHDMVSTTGSALVGLTVGCARCHNHKFDPISQVDYYAIKAVFAGVQHGERNLKPIDFEQKQRSADNVRRDLAAVNQQLSRFEPLAYVPENSRTAHSPTVARGNPGSTLLIDDDALATATADSPDVTQIVSRIGLEPHRNGSGRGQLGDPGDVARFPDLGRNYSYWNDVARKDVFTWNPHVRGQWHIWLSWGCGWNTHANDATYLLDLDGDLATQGDQQEIAKVDQRRFADGSGGGENQPLWSDFFDAGTHSLTATSRIILRGGETSAYVTADLVCLQESDSELESRSPGLPRLRPSVQRQTNIERFPPLKARYVRFVIEATTGGEPCIDELEIFTSMNGSATPPKNVALSSLGTKATSSSSLPGYEIHQLGHLNDGRYGNSASWISNEPSRGWVQFELASPVEIDRVLWSRDRPDNGQFQDRIPTNYRVEAGMTLDSMQVVASSDDRLPFDRQLKLLPTLASLEAADQQLASELTAQRRALEQQLALLSAMPVAYAGRFVTPESTYRLHRGDPLQPKEPTAPAGLNSFGSVWQLPLDAPDSHRRRELANWIIAPEHPLTQRVMANRLWQFHFGQGLVTTPSDFGRNGATPSHPALLDWLACEARSGDSPKRLHRLILLSATYRQSSAARDDAMLADAGTRFLWRFPPRRLEAEPIRDAILMVSGNLDDRMYGPGFDLFESNTNYVKVYNSKHDLGPAEWRRMVYQSKPRMQLDDIFGQFDCPDAGQITPKRTSSITALQALNLLNSPFILQQSSMFAKRLRDEAGEDPHEQTRRGFSLAFHREPSPDELAAAVELILDHGLAAFCRATLNSNEFLFVF